MRLLSVPSRRYGLLGILGILLVALVIAAACGEEATPGPAATATPRPAPTATTAPAATATPVPVATPAPGATATPKPAATATPKPAATATPAPTTGLRPRSEWTLDNPATLEEIEAELEKYRGKSLVWSSWGGAYQASERNAYLIPFEDKFGIEIIEDSQPDNALVRAQVETGNIQWDILSLGQQQVYTLARTNTLEELEFNVIDIRDYFDAVKTPWNSGGGISWSEAIAYNTESYAGNPPTRAADYYDLERYPGRRGWWYYDTPELRFALLAKHPELLDTVEGRNSLSGLTQAEEDEAFEWLEQHKYQVSALVQTGSDCPQLLISGEMDMCSVWNGRIYNAQLEGAPVAICWTCGHLLNTGGFSIPKGLRAQNPEKFELAQLMMAWISFPERNVQISKYISYGPLNLKSLPLLDAPEYDQVRDELPSSAKNIQYAIIHDEEDTSLYADRRYERYLAMWQATD